MYTIQRIKIWNCAKHCALFNVLAILIYCLIFALFALVSFTGGSLESGFFSLLSVGLGFTLVIALLLGIVMGLGFGALFALLYNGLSKLWGPIEVEISFEPENQSAVADPANSEIQQA